MSAVTRVPAMIAPGAPTPPAVEFTTVSATMADPFNPPFPLSQVVEAQMMPLLPESMPGE